MGFSRQEYWSGLPLPYPGDLPDPETEPGSPALQVDSLPSEPSGLCDVLLSLAKMKFFSLETGDRTLSVKFSVDPQT